LPFDGEGPPSFSIPRFSFFPGPLPFGAAPFFFFGRGNPKTPTRSCSIFFCFLMPPSMDGPPHFPLSLCGASFLWGTPFLSKLHGGPLQTSDWSPLFLDFFLRAFFLPFSHLPTPLFPLADAGPGVVSYLGESVILVKIQRPYFFLFRCSPPPPPFFHVFSSSPHGPPLFPPPPEAPPSFSRRLERSVL